MTEFLRHQAPADLLQPGQIRHLALELQTQPDVREDEWGRIARYDAKHIGDELCRLSAAMRDLLSALRILASTSVAVSETELAFVLSDSSRELPSKGRSREAGIALSGGFESEPPAFPSYGMAYRLSREHGDLLDQLEARGLVERTENAYRFSHPSYLIAAEQAIRQSRANAMQRILQLCEMGLFCMSASNAMLAVDALGVLHAEARAKEPRGKVISLVYEGYCGTIFPAVQDRCLLWLLRHRDELDEEMYREVLDAVRYWRRGEDRVIWDERGEAWLDPRQFRHWKDRLSASSLTAQFKAVPEAAKRALEDAKPDERLRPEVLWMHLCRFRSDEVNHLAIERAFSYEESFLRAQAARVAMRDHPDRTDWVDRIAGDGHPRVFAAGVDGLLLRWEDPDHGARVNVLKRLIAAEMSAERATAALRLLKVDDIGSDLPADAWALIVARALSAVSHEETHFAGDLYHYALDFLPKIERSLALEILQAWQAWAEGCVRQRHCSNETVCVARLWMLVSGAEASVRQGVVERLLQQRDTTFFLNSVGYLVEQWDLLDERERALLQQALVGDRTDARWARAMALTRHRPPPALVRLLLGAEDALNSMHKRRLEPAWPHLLEDVLRIADDIGAVTEMGASREYAPLIVRLSMEPQHPLFARALRWCVDNRDRSRLSRFWTQRLWPRLCHGGSRVRDQAFEVLLSASIRIRSQDFDDLWKPLLNEEDMSEDEIARWSLRAGRYAEGIESNDYIHVFLDHEAMARLLLREIPRDLMWYEIYSDDLLVDFVRALVEVVYKDDPPRLSRTHDNVLSALGAGVLQGLDETPDTLIERVRAARLATIKTASRQCEEMRNADQQPIDDWVWLYERAGSGGS